MIRADTKKDYELLQKYQYQALEIERLTNIINELNNEIEKKSTINEYTSNIRF